MELEKDDKGSKKVKIKIESSVGRKNRILLKKRSEVKAASIKENNISDKKIEIDKVDIKKSKDKSALRYNPTKFGLQIFKQKRENEEKDTVKRANVLHCSKKIETDNLRDYQKVPVQDFGERMLREMGWGGSINEAEKAAAKEKFADGKNYLLEHKSRAGLGYSSKAANNVSPNDRIEFTHPNKVKYPWMIPNTLLLYTETPLGDKTDENTTTIQCKYVDFDDRTAIIELERGQCSVPIDRINVLPPSSIGDRIIVIDASETLYYGHVGFVIEQRNDGFIVELDDDDLDERRQFFKKHQLSQYK